MNKENVKKVSVKAKNLQTSAQKLRLVADMIRGENAEEAVNTLKFTNKKAAKFVLKALESAIASAEDLYDAKPSDLVVSSISGDESTTFKRIRYASRGRVSRISKRRAHLNLELAVK